MPDFLNLKAKKLKYTDALIYCTIRSYMNDMAYCYPSYEKIAERSGTSRSFVINSIKRLEESKHLIIQRSNVNHTCNRYYFDKKLQRFERVPFDLLNTDLSLYEKSMMLCVRQFFNEGLLQSTWTINKMAIALGLSYRTVHAQINNLMDKKYISEKEYTSNKYKSSFKYYFITNKIDWVYKFDTRGIENNDLIKIME